MDTPSIGYVYPASCPTNRIDSYSLDINGDRLTDSVKVIHEKGFRIKTLPPCQSDAEIHEFCTTRTDFQFALGNGFVETNPQAVHYKNGNGHLLKRGQPVFDIKNKRKAKILEFEIAMVSEHPLIRAKIEREYHFLFWNFHLPGFAEINDLIPFIKKGE